MSSNSSGYILFHIRFDRIKPIVSIHDKLLTARKLYFNTENITSLICIIIILSKTPEFYAESQRPFMI
jgi:hypothetical protein